jgi:hypothetical protein
MTIEPLLNSNNESVIAMLPYRLAENLSRAIWQFGVSVQVFEPGVLRDVDERDYQSKHFHRD